MRACEPRAEGVVERDGVPLYWEVYGALDEASPTVVLLPTWSVFHSEPSRSRTRSAGGFPPTPTP